MTGDVEWGRPGMREGEEKGNPHGRRENRFNSPKWSITVYLRNAINFSHLNSHIWDMAERKETL